MRSGKLLDFAMIIFVSLILDVSDGMPKILSWIEGYNYCREGRRTLPAPLATSDRYPVWTFGLVVTKYYTDGGQKTILIKSRLSSETAKRCCVPEQIQMCDEIGDSLAGNFSKCNLECQSKNLSLSHITGDSAHANFRNGNYLGHWIWARDVNVTSFFEDANISALCALSDGSGTIKIDDCDKKYMVVCVEDKYSPVFYLPRINESTYDRYEPTSSTNPGTSAKPSESSSIPTEGTGTRPSILPPGVVYVIAGVGVFVVLSVIILGVCCCCCRRKQKKTKKPEDAVVFEAYSDAVDSITIKDDQNLNTVYAVPEDALQRKKAKPRTSITEEEYDVLGKTDRPDRLTTGNVYSHISIGTNRKKNTTTEIVDETYDVTSNKTVPCATQCGDDIYEQLEKPVR